MCGLPARPGRTVGAAPAFLPREGREGGASASGSPRRPLQGQGVQGAPLQAADKALMAFR